MTYVRIGSVVGVVAILMIASTLALRGSASGTNASDLHVSIREWDVPTKGAQPHDPAVGMDGALRFTEQMASKHGWFDPASQSFQEYPLKGKNAGPHGLVSDRGGNIWFTANFSGYIGKLDPRTGEVAQYKMPNKKADDHTPQLSMRRNAVVHSAGRQQGGPAKSADG